MYNLRLVKILTILDEGIAKNSGFRDFTNTHTYYYSSSFKGLKT